MKAFASVALVLLSGCVVQSFHPFYQEQAKTPLPELVGEWTLAAAGSDKAPSVPPWVFTENGELITYDEKGVAGKLRATFFKVGEQLFCDFEAGDTEEGRLNPYWILHVRPVHTVAKVQRTAQQLTLVPLNYEWFKKAVAGGEVNLPHLKRDKDDVLLVTAPPEQWARFLGRYGADTNAFPPNTAYVLRRRSAS